MFARGHAIEAHVEFGAVLRVGVFGMGVGNAESVGLHARRALEAALEGFVLSAARLAVGLTGPVANTLVFVEPEAGSASVLLSHALDTSVENVADALIGMSVKTVKTRAEVIGALRRLKFKTIAAIDVEIMIARLALSAEGVEDETVGAKHFLGDAVVTLVVLVALLRVFEGAVGFGANESLSLT